jgi:hypothetical protein
MSGLLDEIKAYRAPKPECSIGTLLRSLDADDRDDLIAAFADDTVLGTGIVNSLRKRGHNATDNTVNRHRRGSCACDGSAK